MREKDLEEKKKADLLTREEEHLQQEIRRLLGIYRDLAKEGEARGEGKEEIFRKVKEAFQDQAGEREELIKDTGEKLQNTFDFLELAFWGRTGAGSLCHRTEHQSLQYGIYQ